ncbi:GntR family transcriptional regulator [Agromyces albus]|uniref:GntR family transcriptional regulator n=1 Tax=Agromyces albus TaxID=205332 RepID=UPI00277F6725|nr:GntR family transcriptional regulator [Agromyces albus]MDQ0574602.1 DNA-binding GntR family transcriptional regulator [Agromyces albus]
MSAERLRPIESKAQQAYRFIRARIDDGRYVPGFRLVLGQIARELDVSVVPVREAIRLLEAEGLVTFERNVGAQVALIKEAEYLHTMQTLSIVEGAATSMSAPYLTPEHLRRAREINERMRRTLADFDPHRFTALNLEFHAVLFEECPNPHILDLVHRGWNRMKMLRDSSFSFVPGRAHDSVDEHERLVELIESGADPLEIELAARQHRAATLDAVLAYQAAHKLATGQAVASAAADAAAAAAAADPDHALTASND